MDDEFTRAVEDGLKLSKRIYGGKDLKTAAPRTDGGMERSPPSLLPTAPIVYAVIGDPAVVDNPDIPSYQPHVYGRCDPPALIPLQMKEIALEVGCHVDTAVVTVSGRWRVHCVMASRSCDCRLLVPMGDYGPILGVEVNVAKKSYFTRVIETDECQSTEKLAKNESRAFLKPQLFSLTIPEVGGGCDICIKVSWSQKLLFEDGDFSINIPFKFPEYVTPFAKIISRREKIQLNVYSGTGKDVVCRRNSHPLKEKGHDVGNLAFLYEAEVDYWSSKDFHFSYSIYSSDLFGGIILQSPPSYYSDQSNRFCLYLFPGNNQSRKVFRKEVVFIVDISGSMQGKPLEYVKNALSTALLDLNPEDGFDIIAFNEEMYLFSSSMELASEATLECATQWITKNFVAGGGTNILNPLNEALRLLSNTRDALSHIYLITDGAVEDERDICYSTRSHITHGDINSPRISTFGIGSFCNHYFLRTLASIGRGQYDAAYDSDSIEVRLPGWMRKTSFPIVANITIDFSDNFDAIEVYPSHIPDLSRGSPLVISGVYQGKFPDSIKAKGRLADMSDIVINLKAQNTKDVPLETVIAKQQIDLLTADAWFNQSKQLEEKVAKLSIQSGILSEYTYMVLLQLEAEKQEAVKQQTKKYDHQKQSGDLGGCVRTLLQGLTVGFGNITATLENTPTGFGEQKPPETSDVFDKAVGCCSRLCDCCCCMCCIRTISRMNDQCLVVATQLCTAFACLGCLECCSICCDDSN